MTFRADRGRGMGMKTDEPIDPSKPLKPHENERFVQERLKGKSQREAYRAAYPKSKKWKDATADSKACILEARSKIGARLEWLKSQAADESVMSVIERKRILSEIARADPADYMVAGKDGTWITFGPESKNRRSVAGIKSRTTEDGAVITEIKLREPHAAIDLLNKMEGVYVEKHEQLGPDGKVIDPTPRVILIDNRVV